MKLQKKKAVIVGLSTMLVSGLFFANSSFAADATKTLKAVYSNIKLVYNGQTITSSSGQEPFVVDGSTYVPIRMAGEALGKSLFWDASTKQIIITDVTTPADQQTITNLKNEVKELEKKVNTLTSDLNTANSDIKTKDAKITSLEAQITTLQKAVDKKSSGDDLDDLEEDLNDDYYNYYKNLDAEISLSGDEDDITVKIEVDEDVWDDYDSDDQKEFLQEIVDDILDEFEDADISGTVRNQDSDKLGSFTVSSSGNVRW
ncbi:stalk domain-containing protein [Paenibacillus sp. M1]|uniref:Stalk domain-containing protein n=1 Tax=Paenibacillus haidiansis TaxID=1574488 RepID=A0ABU7VWB5_9BACL